MIACTAIYLCVYICLCASAATSDQTRADEHRAIRGIEPTFPGHPAESPLARTVAGLRAA